MRRDRRRPGALVGAALVAGCLGASVARAGQPGEVDLPAPAASEPARTNMREGPAPAAWGGTLDLPDVLRSVAAEHPQLEAAEQRLRQAEGAEMAARGGFDPVLRMRGQYIPLGGYKNGRFDVEVRQPTPLYGLQLYAGWRVGLGKFPLYDYRAKTASGGELRAGAVLPLWQGGPIDRRRADVRIAAIGKDAARAELEARLIELERTAARAYWTWVLTGLRRAVEQQLLELAETRDAGLQRQIAAGSVPAVEGLDNRRAVLDRGARLVAAERNLQQAALALARHLRDGDGQMVVPGPSQLPSGFPAPARPPDDIDAIVEDAWQRRPDLLRLSLQREIARVEQKLARNNRAPKIDLEAMVAKDLGFVDPVDQVLLPTDVVTAVTFEMPLPLRQARGNLRRADAEVARIEAELRFLRDSIAAEVRDAYAALVAAHARVELARAQVDAARQLAEAERTRFQRGDSTLLFVNLREQAAADAQQLELEALADYHRAVADLRAAAGLRLGG